MQSQDVETLLNIEAEKLFDVAFCKNTLTQFGCIVARDIVDPTFMGNSRPAISQIHDAIQDKNGNAYLFDFQNHSEFLEERKNFIFGLMKNFVISNFIETVREYLGGKDVIFLGKGCIVRKMKPPYGTAVPFHQDSGFAFERFPGLNIWLPFNEVGESAPRLALIATERREPFYNHPIYARGLEEGDFCLNEDAVLQDFSDLLVEPKVSPGDACVFDLKTIHRTSFHSGMTMPRMSLELRVCCLDDLTKNPDTVAKYSHGVILTRENNLIFSAEH